MSKPRTPIFLARAYEDADDLVEQLRGVRVGAEISEVTIGKAQAGWQVLVAAGDAERARSIATVLEVQRYGNWESRPGTESHWGVIEDEHAIGDPTEIYCAESVVEAHLLKNFLAEQGITAIVSNQLLHGGSGVDFVGLATAARVVVPADDAAVAREFALEFEARSRETSAGQLDSEASPAWPTCPECGARRTTRCPICATSGTDFGEADRNFLGELATDTAGASCGCTGCCSARTGAAVEGSHGKEEPPDDEEAGDHRALLMCSVCDEPFEPAYPKHCEWCGHEFADGYQIEQIVDSESISGRAIAVAAALGLFLLAGFAYFLFVVSR